MTKALLMIVVCLVALNVEARAGGGGRGSGGGGSGSVVGGAIAAIVYAIIELRRRHMMKKAKTDRENAVKTDPTWAEDKLRKAAETCFERYQDAWTTRDLESVRHLLHVDYFQKAQRILNDEMAGQTNVIKNPVVLSMNLMAIRDVPGKDGDMFVMEMNASMVDYTIDTKTGEFIESTLDREDGESQAAYETRAKVEAGPFREYWVFQRVSDVWKLWEIQDSSSIISDLKGKSEAELKAILAREQASGTSDDSVFFKKTK